MSHTDGRVCESATVETAIESCRSRAGALVAHGSETRARSALWILLIAAALTPSTEAGAAATAAQLFSPGPGVFVTSGGAAQNGTFGAVSSLGQPILGVATHDDWSLWTGILTALPRSPAIAVAHTPLGLATAGAPLAVEGEIVSSRPVDSATLHYRQGGRNAYTPVEMVNDGGDTWSASIPGAGVALRGIEYYIEAAAAGRVAYSPSTDPATRPHRVAVRVADFDGDGALGTAARAYRMISFPAALGDGSEETVLEDDLGAPDSTVWRCGAWDCDAERYLEAGRDAMAPFAPGRAAWLITDRARSVDFTGQTVVSSNDGDYAVTLEPGWNQIGCPFAFDVALDDMRIDDGTLIRTFAQAVAAGLLEAQPLHEYDGAGYRVDDEAISPWTGYFVANLGGESIELLIPAREASGAAGKQMVQTSRWDAPQWLFRMRAGASAGRTAEVEFGAAAGASDGWDRWDQLQPPATPDPAVAARFVNESLPARLSEMKRDIRPMSYPGATWALEVSAQPGDWTQISWDPPADLPAGQSARLIDAAGGTWVDMTCASSYTVYCPGSGVVKLKAAVGSVVWLDRQTGDTARADARFSASILGGNPQRGAMQVRLALPSSERVCIQAYDVHGRLVKTLSESVLDAGVHVIPWDGRRESGQPAAAGVYFLHVGGTGHETVLRSVLLR